MLDILLLDSFSEEYSSLKQFLSAGDVGACPASKEWSVWPSSPAYPFITVQRSSKEPRRP